MYLSEFSRAKAIILRLGKPQDYASLVFVPAPADRDFTRLARLGPFAADAFLDNAGMCAVSQALWLEDGTVVGCPDPVNILAQACTSEADAIWALPAGLTIWLTLVSFAQLC